MNLLKANAWSHALNIDHTIFGDEFWTAKVVLKACLFTGGFVQLVFRSALSEALPLPRNLLVMASPPRRMSFLVVLGAQHCADDRGDFRVMRPPCSFLYNCDNLGLPCVQPSFCFRSLNPLLRFQAACVILKLFCKGWRLKCSREERISK